MFQICFVAFFLFHILSHLNNLSNLNTQNNPNSLNSPIILQTFWVSAYLDGMNDSHQTLSPRQALSILLCVAV